MSTLFVPALDEQPWPTLGPQIVEFLEDCAVYGPGSLKGQPYKVDPEFKAQLYRAYEVYPRGHQFAGRRRFKRVGISCRKGLAKTEKMALVSYAELHPDGPVRCDGFDARGNPVGRPVADPYIPLLAFSKEQVEELAYGALMVIVQEGPEAHLFDAGMDRILRLDARGRADGKCVPLAGSPNARDGARTTFQGLDEPHRLYLPRLIQAHETMTANLAKRAMEDPWTLYVGTAGEPGQGSVQEMVHQEAELIAQGEIDDPQLCYFHREAGPGYDLDVLEQRVAAVIEATGPIGEYGPGQFRDIARQWERPGADKSYLERVWLNRWTRSDEQAFDVKRWDELSTEEPIPFGAFVAAGFDGARFRDSTAIVLTDFATGRQQLWAIWERPLDVDEWEVPEEEVTAAWAEIQSRFVLWNCYGDPPHWTETFGSWAARWPDHFEEWWTNRTSHMSRAVRGYGEAMASGAVKHVLRPGNPVDEAFDRHIAAAGRKDVNLWDGDQRLFVLKKIHEDRKFDGAMAGCLSWTAYLDGVKSGVKPPPIDFLPYRIR